MLKPPEDFADAEDYVKYAIKQIGLIPTAKKIAFFANLSDDPQTHNKLVADLYEKHKDQIVWS